MFFNNIECVPVNLKPGLFILLWVFSNLTDLIHVFGSHINWDDNKISHLKKILYIIQPCRNEFPTTLTSVCFTASFTLGNKTENIYSHICQ